MTVTGVAAAGIYASGQQVQGPGQHKHGHRQASPISDVDAQSSSVAQASSSTGRIGSKVNITA